MSEGRKGREKFDEFRLALGKFVHHFAFTEDGLRQCIRIMTNVHPSILRVLTDNRIDKASQNIRRLFEIYPNYAEYEADVIDALNHLAEINSLRNALLHNITSEP